MDVIILTIGSEILKGRTINTNAGYIAAKLYAAGFNVRQERAVADSEETIVRALGECFSQAELIIATGGLGPTRDDVTKSAACRYFGRGLLFDQEYFARLEDYFRRIGYERFPERSRNQAYVPERAKVLPNSRGTAPGLLLEDAGKVLILLPGVPGEMKALLEEEVLPYLVERFRREEPHSAVVRTVGLGESVIAERIEEGLAEIQTALLSYYPHSGMVDIVIASAIDAPPADRESIAQVAEHVAGRLEGHVYAREEKSLWEVIADLLTARGETLAAAESCTGGLISKSVTDLAGSSRWFNGSVVSYADRAKTDLLGVDPALVRRQGAVSEEVALAMARGALEAFHADWSLALTGIAGPSGGSQEKPIGTVFIAVAGPGKQAGRRFQFGGDRAQIRQRSAIKAAELLWRSLLAGQPVVDS